MNRYKLSKAGISVSEGVRRFGGNVERYETLLKKFPTDTHFQAMCSSIKAGNAKEAFAAAHALKGAVGNLSMNRLFVDIQPLVEALRVGDVANAEKLLPVVAEDYNEVIVALTQQL